jgi:hypothetical protein
MKRSAIAAALAALALTSVPWAPTAQARPVSPAEQRFWSYSGETSACSNLSALQEIAWKFSERENEYWRSGLAILAFDRIREIGNRTPGLDFIPRRYCTARAAFNDGSLRDVSYWIGENTGFAGYGERVEWCVVGLDRHNADAPGCKMARP